MGVQSHVHDWTNGPGGIQCQNCSARLGDNTLATTSTAIPGSHRDFTNAFNYLWKKTRPND